jgi:hypothetical protein
MHSLEGASQCTDPPPPHTHTSRGRPSLERALAQHPNYALVLTGHSLGGGLATLLAALLGPSVTVRGDGGEGGGGGGGGGGNESVVPLSPSILLPTTGPEPFGSSAGGSSTRQVRCYAYAPPAVLSLELARSMSTHITSVVVADDMVPRFGTLLNMHGAKQLFLSSFFCSFPWDITFTIDGGG